MTNLEAYRFIGLCMAALAARDRGPLLAARLEDPDIDWPLIIGISSRRLVTPALSSCFRLHGLTESLDPEVRQYLSVIHELNRERNLAILQQLHEVVLRLNVVGVQPTLIKGAAHLATGLYCDPGARMMGDIDVLVPECRLPPCVEALQALGYTAPKAANSELEHRHFPALVHADREARVELHRWATPNNRVEATEILRESRPCEMAGARFGVPSRKHALMLNIIHACSGPARFPGLPDFRSALDYALLQNAPGEDADWAEIELTLRSAGEERSMKAFLDTAHWLLGLSPPLGLENGLHLKLTRLARTAYASSRLLEVKIVVALFFMSRMRILPQRFAALEPGEFVFRLFSLRKWLNQLNAFKHVIYQVK